MRIWQALVAGLVVAFLPITIAGCTTPTLHAQDVEVRDGGRELHASFIDDDGEEVVHVRVATTPYSPSGDHTEIGVYIDHRDGTDLESLEFAFVSQKYTGVYLFPQDRWPDDMEFLKTADGPALTVPHVGDIGVNSVLYRFLAPTVAMSEPPDGLPLRVTFVLDGLRRTAEFNVPAPRG